MRKSFITLLLFFPIFLILLFFTGKNVSAASECVGELTGAVGECQTLCGPTKRADGNEECGFLQKCCVPEEKVPGSGVPCTGLESGKLGSCQTLCGPNLRADGVNHPNDVCLAGQKCCVDPSEDKPLEFSGASPFGECGEGSIDTAIGCIPVKDPNEFIGFILRWAIGVGGGIAFLLGIFAGFQIMTSAGNPERLKAGQELLTSAIAGLILLIFSVFILRVIGIDILKIPGFGG